MMSEHAAKLQLNVRRKSRTSAWFSELQLHFLKEVSDEMLFELVADTRNPAFFPCL